MQISDDQIKSIVDRVVANIAGGTPAAPKTQSAAKSSSGPAAPKLSAPDRDRELPDFLGVFPTVDMAIAAATKSFDEYRSVKVEQRRQIIEAIRELSLAHIHELSKMAVDETGLGRYEDKLQKNRLAITKTPGVEDLDPIVFTGDRGLTLLEKAPFGVIGSITPCTNPTETIINNGIGMIAGGNTVCFHPHPAAKRVSAYTVHLLNKAVLSAGGPCNLFTCVAGPTIASAQALMVHPGISLLVVTGGPAVVGVAMKSGKRVIAAGPGNPPVVVDETADFDKAARDIVVSAGMDNNIICVIEKEIIVTKGAAEPLKRALLRSGAIEVGEYQARRLEKLVVGDHGHPNKDWVGKDIQLILKQLGMDCDPKNRIAIAETGPDHSFATCELLLPVLPFIRVDNIDQAIECAYKLEGGCFHTAAIHSRNIDNMHKMAAKMNTSIFVKNGPALAGLGFEGEGPTSFTIASPTGEGVTTARHFTRIRRCVVSGHFRIV